MSAQFTMSDDAQGAAMEYIAHLLTGPQKSALVTARVRAGENAVVALVHANENTLRALMAPPVPLVASGEGHTRKLTALGTDVARYLITTGEWDIPATGLGVPGYLASIDQ